jgi:hypothetical protein
MIPQERVSIPVPAHREPGDDIHKKDRSEYLYGISPGPGMDAENHPD